MHNKVFAFIILFTSFASANPLRLALNWKAEPEFGGFYAAQLEGYYDKQKLELQIFEGGSGTPTVQMLANNKVEFAIVSADELLISNERNPQNKIVALFAAYQKSPYIIMTHAENNFKNLKEVFQSDGVISIQSGLPYYQFLVKKFGKPRAKIVPYLGGISNFILDKNVSQQGFLTTEPLSAQKKGLVVKNFLIADEGFNPYLVVLASTQETLKKNPDLVKKMVLATRQGWKTYLDNPDKTNVYMSGLNKSLDIETFKNSAIAQKSLIDSNSLGCMTTERWKILAQQLVDLRLISKIPRVEEIFTNCE